MADFNIRSDAVDVEQIMKQIRARIQEKRGVDYTEEQIRELAAVRLEKFLDPKNLRSDLLEQFRRSRPAIPAEPPPVDAPYTFSDETLFASHRGPLRVMRKLLRPLLKLFFNPNTLNQVLHAQAQFNVDLLKREQRRKIEFERSRSEWNALYYEVLHNLVLETTRNGIELKNLKMRVEALASRLDFNERRVRALEGVVQYRPEVVRPRPSTSRETQGRAERVDERDRSRETTRPELETSPGNSGTADASESAAGSVAAGAGVHPAAGDAGGRRRRRRRRGRRGAGLPQAAGPIATEPGSAEEPEEDAFEDGEELDAPAEARGGPEDAAEPAVSGDPAHGDPSDPDRQ